MTSIFTRKDVQKALADAKRLAEEPAPPREHAEYLNKKCMSHAEELKKLLKPSWFIRDIDESNPISKKQNVKKKRQKKTTQRKKK